MERDLITRLLAVAEIAALVGDRVSWFELARPDPGDTWSAALPAILLTNAAPGQSWTHQGPNALINPRVQIDVYSEIDGTTEALADLIKAEMQRLDEVVAGDTRFLPPAPIHIWNPHKDQIAGTEALPGVPVFCWLIDLSFFCQPAT